MFMPLKKMDIRTTNLSKKKFNLATNIFLQIMTKYLNFIRHPRIWADSFILTKLEGTSSLLSNLAKIVGVKLFPKYFMLPQS